MSSGGHIDAMNSSMRLNKSLLKGKASFNSRRALYMGVLDDYIKLNSKEDLSPEELEEIRELVRLKIRERNRYNTLVLIFAILLGITLLSVVVCIFLA
ncbi:MAG: hypothetical protein JXR19_01225 [Bacteroidia bacterium]